MTLQVDRFLMWLLVFSALSSCLPISTQEHELWLFESLKWTNVLFSQLTVLLTSKICLTRDTSLTALVPYLLSHNLSFAASVFQDDTLFQTACMHPWSRRWSLIASQSYRTHKKFKTKAEWRWEYVGVSWCLDEDVLCSFFHIHSWFDHVKCQILRFLTQFYCCCCVYVIILHTTMLLMSGSRSPVFPPDLIEFSIKGAGFTCLLTNFYFWSSWLLNDLSVCVLHLHLPDDSHASLTVLICKVSLRLVCLTHLLTHSLFILRQPVRVCECVLLLLCAPI